MRTGWTEASRRSYATSGVLNELQKEKNLGVVTDSRLNFEEHLAEKRNKENRLVGLIRSFVTLNEAIFRTLYTALVRPHLDQEDSVRRGHNKEIYKQQVCLNLRKYSFSNSHWWMEQPSWECGKCKVSVETPDHGMTEECRTEKNMLIQEAKKLYI